VVLDDERDDYDAQLDELGAELDELRGTTRL
jgi:hypothetical protein